MLILQDGAGDDLEKIAHSEPGVKFVRYPGESRIGRKRNYCCELATGEIIAHWDDDDWSYRGRLGEQVAAIQSGHPVVGYRNLHFYDERTRKAHIYTGAPDYIVGTSMCYRREWWEAHKFGDLAVGEDNDFRDRARSVLLALDGLGKMVALSHAGGTSPRVLKTKQWREVNPAELPWMPEAE